MSDRIVVLGVFVADTAYRADRAPKMGETIMGNSFALGPGGKGSNQAVAAAKAGGEVHFLSKLGRDPFADMALKTWKLASSQRSPSMMTAIPGRHTSSSRKPAATTRSLSAPVSPAPSRPPISRRRPTLSQVPRSSSPSLNSRCRRPTARLKSRGKVVRSPS